MSIDTCSACSAFVDTDYDDDCYQCDLKGKLVCFCPSCREKQS